MNIYILVAKCTPMLLQFRNLVDTWNVTQMALGKSQYICGSNT